MKANNAIKMAAIAALFGAELREHGPKTQLPKKKWQPEFTEEELELVRSKPTKSARKKMVHELRQKYLKAK